MTTYTTEERGVRAMEIAVWFSCGAASAVAAWQDISTAPESDTVILWEESWLEPMLGCRGADRDFYDLSTLCFPSDPTHWMPLPEPPRSEYTCRKCGGYMKTSQALAQTFVGGTPDFPDDSHATTISAGGSGKLINCWKCENCGWSVTPQSGEGE